MLVRPWWQRALHWALAGAVLAALVTYEGGRLHEAAGYAVLGVSLARIGFGFAGPRSSRFATFVRGPRATWSHLLQVLRREDPRYVNHNPLGAWMVLALLGMSLGGAASGWLYVTDRYWGEAWAIALHAALTWPLAPLAVIHVAGVVHGSRRHRENLVAAMWHGRKRGATTSSAQDQP